MAQPATAQPSTSSAAPDPTLDTLALQACDDADNLRDVLCIYTTVENLIAPSRVGDDEEITLSRRELSAALRLANEELRRRIDAVDNTATLLRDALVTSELGKSSIVNG